MATWKAANFNSLIPSQFSNLTSSLTTPINAITTGLKLTNAGLDIAKKFISSFGGFDFVGTLATLVANFRRDFDQAGIYYLGLWDAGLDDLVFEQAREAITGQIADEAYKAKISRYFSSRYTSGAKTFQTLGVPGTVVNSTQGNSWQKFVGRITASLDDGGDKNRPQLSSTAASAGIVLAAGAPTLTEFLLFAKQLQKLFPKQKDLDTVACKLARVALVGYKRTFAYPEEWPIEIMNDSRCLPKERLATLNPTMRRSTPPDWHSLSIRQIEPIRPVFEILDKSLAAATASLQTAANSEKAIVQLISAIQTKIRNLVTLLNQLNEQLANLQSILTATGIYALYFTSSNGNAGIKTALNSANTSAVPFARRNVTGLGQDAFIAGAVFMAAGPQVKPFEQFFGKL